MGAWNEDGLKEAEMETRPMPGRTKVWPEQKKLLAQPLSAQGRYHENEMSVIQRDTEMFKVEEAI